MYTLKKDVGSNIFFQRCSLKVPWFALQCLNVVFPDHTHFNRKCFLGHATYQYQGSIKCGFRHTKLVHFFQKMYPRYNTLDPDEANIKFSKSSQYQRRFPVKRLLTSKLHISSSLAFGLVEQNAFLMTLHIAL